MKKFTFVLTKAAGDNFILARLISSLPKSWNIIVYVDGRYIDVLNFFDINAKPIFTPPRYHGFAKIFSGIYFFTILYVKCLIKILNGHKIVLPFGDYYELILYYMLFKRPIIKLWHEQSDIRKTAIFPKKNGQSHFINIYDEFIDFFKKNIYINSYLTKGKRNLNKNTLLVCSRGSQFKKKLHPDLISSIINSNLNKKIYIDAEYANTIRINCDLKSYIKLIGTVEKVFTVESLAQHVASYYGVECVVYPGGGEPLFFTAPGCVSVYNDKPSCYPCYNDKTLCNFDCFINEN